LVPGVRIQVSVLGAWVRVEPIRRLEVLGTRHAAMVNDRGSGTHMELKLGLVFTG
jgi:hypothetical protein